MPTNDPLSYMFGPGGPGPAGMPAAPAAGVPPPGFDRNAFTRQPAAFTGFSQLPATPDTQGSVFSNDMMRSQQPFNFSPDMLRMIMGSLPGGGSFSFGAQSDPRGGMPMVGGRAGMPFRGGELGASGMFQPGNMRQGDPRMYQMMIDYLRRF